jgi:toxin ParE1/3/4
VKRRQLGWSPPARDDLQHIHDYISDAGSPINALRFIERIAAYCETLDHASERGQRRDDIRQGLRVVGFERRVAIAFQVDDERVKILRIFYGGVDWESAL